METIMELDELKSAWRTLDRHMQQQSALNLHLFKESRYERIRASLRLLAWGQSLILAFGIACTLTAGSLWFDHRTTPHLLIAGLVMHLYGVAVIVVTARTFWLMAQVDYSAPVLAIQQQLARFQHFYLRTGWYIGLPWLLLWVPFSMMFCVLFGFDLYAAVPKFVPIGLAGGAVWLLLVVLVDRYVRWPTSMAKAIEDGQARSIKNAQDLLDEIARFERP